MASEAKHDLTSGSVWRQLIRYSVPMITTSILQALYSIADIYIAGCFIGSSGISAINNASQIISILTTIVIGLSLGGNILVGQYFGSRDDKNREKTTGTFFSLFFILGAVCSVIGLLCARPLMTAMGSPALEDAITYLKISAAGIFFIFGYNALSAVLRAVGNSKKPMQFIILSSLLNIALDILFVGPMHLGTAGAAAATVIAQAVSFFLALFYILKEKSIFVFTWPALKICKDKLKPILKLGIPCAIQWAVAGISWLTVTFIINRYGITVSAGNGISNKIRDFTMLFINAMSASASSMIAQNLGARLYDRAKEIMYQAMKLTVLITLALIAVVELLAPFLIGLFTNETEVIACGVLNIRIEVIGQLGYAVFLIYHSLATGAGHTPFVLFSSFVNCIIFRMPLAVLFNMWFGLPGLYAALAFAPFTSVPLGMGYTKSNIWRRTLAKSDTDRQTAKAGGSDKEFQAQESTRAVQE